MKAPLGRGQAIGEDWLISPAKLISSLVLSMMGRFFPATVCTQISRCGSLAGREDSSFSLAMAGFLRMPSNPAWTRIRPFFPAVPLSLIGRTSPQWIRQARMPPRGYIPAPRSEILAVIIEHQLSHQLLSVSRGIIFVAVGDGKAEALAIGQAPASASASSRIEAGEVY